MNNCQNEPILPNQEMAKSFLNFWLSGEFLPNLVTLDNCY